MRAPSVWECDARAELFGTRRNGQFPENAQVMGTAFHKGPVSQPVPAHGSWVWSEKGPRLGDWLEERLHSGCCVALEV